MPGANAWQMRPAIPVRPMKHQNQNRTADRVLRSSFITTGETGINSASRRHSDTASSVCLDDHIRQLCAQVAVLEGSIWPALAELRSALRVHNQRMRSMAARKLLGPD